MGPANALIDDLCSYFYKKILIKMDYYAQKGTINKNRFYINLIKINILKKNIQNH